MFSNIPADQKYDLILSNPPYIDPDLDRTETAVKEFEPHQALYGGKRGLEIIERIIKKAPKHLSSAGQLWLEHEPEQAEEIKKLARESNFNAINERDQYGILRYSILKQRA